MKSALCAIALCFLYCCTNSMATETNWYSSIIPDNYTKELSPKEKVNVQLSTYFIQFHDYDDKTKQLSGDLYLRFHWEDSRLQNPNVSFKKCIVSSPTLKNYIWVPDVFIFNAVKYELAGGPNSFVKINQTDGAVTYSQKVQVRVPCKSSADSTGLECGIHFESFGHNAESMTLEWKQEPGYSADNIYTPSLYLEGMTNNRSDIVFTHATYSRLSVTFKFRKDLDEYVRDLIAQHVH